MANTAGFRKTTFRSQDLSCPSCVSKIERALSATPGVADAKVHFTTGRIVVEHDPSVAPANLLVNVIGRTGYKAKVSA